ncbi:hypothetical protein U2A4042190011 [Corynebacterium striatum]|nr:hypothetical protein U2A4042190011 [Corynebacterium striatum]
MLTNCYLLGTPSHAQAKQNAKTATKTISDLPILQFSNKSVKVTSRCTAGKQASRTTHAPLAQLAEQLTLNQWVRGSSP